MCGGVKEPLKFLGLSSRKPPPLCCCFFPPTKTLGLPQTQGRGPQKNKRGEWPKKTGVVPTGFLGLVEPPLGSSPPEDPPGEKNLPRGPLAPLMKFPGVGKGGKGALGSREFLGA